MNDKVIRFLEAAHASQSQAKTYKGPLYLGVDLGTASIVLAVVDEKGQPVTLVSQEAQVVRDGLVVDYGGACSIVKSLKETLEDRLSTTFEQAAIALPPGTMEADTRTHQYVTESAGLLVDVVVDEPTAANEVLGLSEGVIVDIGGGTTGLTVFEGGHPLFSADEPTGGIHATLVIAGHHKCSLEEAERIKKDPARSAEMAMLLRPVYQRMAGIVRSYISGHLVKHLVLVGGSTALEGVEALFEKETAIASRVPPHPEWVTPFGIALCQRKSQRKKRKEVLWKSG